MIDLKEEEEEEDDDLGPLPGTLARSLGVNHLCMGSSFVSVHFMQE